MPVLPVSDTLSSTETLADITAPVTLLPAPDILRPPRTMTAPVNWKLPATVRSPSTSRIPCPRPVLTVRFPSAWMTGKYVSHAPAGDVWFGSPQFGGIALFVQTPPTLTGRTRFRRVPPG